MNPNDVEADDETFWQFVCLVARLQNRVANLERLLCRLYDRADDNSEWHLLRVRMYETAAYHEPETVDQTLKDILCWLENNQEDNEEMSDE